MKKYLNGKTTGIAKVQQKHKKWQIKLLLRQQPLEQGKKQMKTKC